MRKEGRSGLLKTKEKIIGDGHPQPCHIFKTSSVH